jgi:hypothetical protein
VASASRRCSPPAPKERNISSHISFKTCNEAIWARRFEIVQGPDLQRNGGWKPSTVWHSLKWRRNLGFLLV